MSMGLRYKYGFYSYNNTLYNVEIWQEGWTGEVKPVAFTDDVLVIDWQETDKLKPVQSSSAKLTLMSDDDRQFIDLYTVKAGSIRLDVYKGDVLYWSGTLDPELYEEPFSYKTGYGVELTFSDFAILDRLKWQDTGFKTLKEVIELALSASGIHYAEITEYISTSYGGRGNLLEAVSVQCQNFFDEDGEPMTIREVLDETLRPFALRLIQKEGKVFIYDLNAIYTELKKEEVYWDGDDATYSIDKVYNSIEIKHSPYENYKMASGSIDPETVDGESHITYMKTRNVTRDEVGFYTYLSDNGKGMEKNPLAKYYRIEPVYSGSDDSGIAWTFENFTAANSGQWVSHIQEPSQQIGQMLLKVPLSTYLSHRLDGIWSNRDYQLKVSVKLLFDPRYNPYEGASEDNEQNSWDYQQNRANFAYVPVKIVLRDDSGNALYHWYNNGVKDSDSYVHANTAVGWKSGEGGWGEAWLCWYQGNRKSESGLGDWKTNKPIIGYYRGELPTFFDKVGEGELIDLPDTGGYIDMQVGTGIVIYDYGKEIKDSNYERCRFMFFKEPSIELVDSRGGSLSAKDVSIQAWLNKDAKEDLSIDTVLGTMPNPSPVALGQLYDSSNHGIISSFTRSGVTDQLEKLLIGTVYSNYAGRNVILSGTARILPSFAVYTDKNEAGSYILLSESQDLRGDTSEIKMVQFEADNYEGVQFK